MTKSSGDAQEPRAYVCAQVQDALRGAAISLMEAADRLVDWIEHDLDLPVPPWAATEEPQVSEEPEEPEEKGDSED